MKILFIGGNGNISWHCTQLAIEHGHEVWQLNREISVVTRRRVQSQVHKLKGNMRETAEVKRLLDGCSFDVVCDFICYNGEQAKNDIEIFRNKTRQFMFISSDSIYKRRPLPDDFPYAEDNEQYDANSCDCDYIVGKLEAEQVFIKAWEQENFPVTIIRPSYTYDTIFPISIGHNCFTAEELILQGYPLLVAGEGNNRWTFTHSSDFAGAFIGLVGNLEAVGEAFNISTDEKISWNEQSELVLNALHIENNKIFHVPYEDALDFSEIQPKIMMFQRMQNNVACIDKVMAYVPGWRPRVSFEEGIQRTVRWLNEDARHKRHVDRIYSALMAVYERYGIKL